VSDNDPTLNEVLDELLGEARTGNLPEDITAAGKEIWRRRQRNTLLGGIVIGYAVAPTDDGGAGMTYREWHQRTGIPVGTAHRWALPPGETDRT
jgi:hypothetical protein